MLHVRYELLDIWVHFTLLPFSVINTPTFPPPPGVKQLYSVDMTAWILRERMILSGKTVTCSNRIFHKVFYKIQVYVYGS